MYNRLYLYIYSIYVQIIAKPIHACMYLFIQNNFTQHTHTHFM